MKLDELADFLESELSYPIDQDAVVERVGDVEIEAPNEEETQSVSTIIDAVGQETYRSSDELYTTIIGNVSDDYIGRKFYDDRGVNPPEMETAPGDEGDVSF